MKIELYYIVNRKTDVKKNLSIKIMEVEGTLKFPTNFLDPIIRIQDTREVLPLEPEMPFYNYAYIREFRRFYFIQNMVFISNRLIDLYMHVDVLHTYIGAENGPLRYNVVLVNRNQYDYNEKIEDTRYHFEAIPSVTYDLLQPIDRDATDTFVEFKNNFDYSKPNVLVTIMTMRTGSPELVEQPNTNNSSYVRGNYSAISMGTTTYCLTWEQAQDIAKQCFTSESIRTLIQSMIVLPFNIPANKMNLDRSDGRLYLMDVPPSPDIPVYIQIDSQLDQNVYTLFSSASINFYTYYAEDISDYFDFNDTFFDNEKYTIYDLYIPFVGWQTLDRSLIKKEGKFKINYVLDALTGNCKVQVTMDKELIINVEANLGIKVNLSSTNLWENQQRENAISANQTTSAVLGGLTTVVGTLMALGSGGSLAPMGIGMAVAGISTMFGSGVKGEGEKSLLFHRGNQGSYSACDSLYLYDYPIIRTTKNVIAETYLDITYLEENGAPLFRSRIVKNLLGYTEVGKCDFSIENVQEEKELTELLQNGVHFPTTSGW